MIEQVVKGVAERFRRRTEKFEKLDRDFWFSLGKIVVAPVGFITFYHEVKDVPEKFDSPEAWSLTNTM